MQGHPPTRDTPLATLIIEARARGGGQKTGRPKQAGGCTSPTDCRTVKIEFTCGG